MSQLPAADPEKRKVYDAYGEEGLKAGAPPPVSPSACTCVLSHISRNALADAACRSIVSAVPVCLLQGACGVLKAAFASLQFVVHGRASEGEAKRCSPLLISVEC